MDGWAVLRPSFSSVGFPLLSHFPPSILPYSEWKGWAQQHRFLFFSSRFIAVFLLASEQQRKSVQTDFVTRNWSSNFFFFPLHFCFLSTESLRSIVSRFFCSYSRFRELTRVGWQDAGGEVVLGQVEVHGSVSGLVELTANWTRHEEFLEYNQTYYTGEPGTREECR